MKKIKRFVLKIHIFVVEKLEQAIWKKNPNQKAEMSVYKALQKQKGV